MILNHKQLIIFGYPRSATKLLASILKDFDYHSYGEWYDVWSCGVTENTTSRLSPEKIRQIKINRDKHPEKIFTEQAKKEFDLDNLWREKHQLLQPEKWLLTLWPNNLGIFPFAIHNFKDCYWLCTTRDRWTQLLSWFISSTNDNFDGNFESKPIKVNEVFFQRSYWQLRRTELWQQWVLENFQGTKVPFEQLVTGTFSGFGKDYLIKSKDEHKDLESLILNINEVKEWFIQAEAEVYNTF